MPSSTSDWDRASALAVSSSGRRSAVLATLPAGMPGVETLFEFMRDAESRFGSLKMRIDCRTRTSAGEEHQAIDLAIVHPGAARVATAWPDRGTAQSYDLWVSDGVTVRAYSGIHGVGTIRPARRPVQGTDGEDLPGRSRVYHPITPLPADSLVDTFVHPAGFCQNVLATGWCRVTGSDEVSGREAVVLVCDHPRTTQMAGDRPDYRIDLAVDRETGVILRQLDRLGDVVTRSATVVAFEPDAPVPASQFELAFPSDARVIF